jgi:DNA-binding NtrC family response regulator
MNSIETAVAIARDSALEAPRKGPFAHILLVDDDPIFRAMTRLTLIQLGHSVSVAEDAKSAFEIAAQNKDIRLLIADVVMPGMNGVLLARNFRAILPHCKVLYISGYTRSTLAATGEPDDSAYFLQKPFSRARLDGCIKTALAGTQ